MRAAARARARARTRGGIAACARAAAVLAAIAAAVLAIAGCGGGSSAPTKSQFIAKANALCVSEKQQLTQVALAKTKLPVTLERATTVREQSITQLEGLKNPKTDPISPEWLALRKRALALAKRIAALGLGSRAARPLNFEYVTVSNNAERIAHAYGLTQCRGFAAV